jgi:signal transduction histidine kinase
MRTPEPEAGAGRSFSLAEAITRISAGGSRTDSLERLVDAACALAGMGHGALAVLDSNGGIGEVLHRGLNAEQAAGIGRLSLGTGVLHEIADAREPLVYDDVPGVELVPGSGPGDHPRAARMVGVPVRAHGRTLALLLLGDTESRARLHPTLATDLGALAGVAAYLLEIQHADSLAERHRIWLNQSSQLSAELQPPLIVDDALSMIATGALRASGARSALIITVPSPGAPYPAAMGGATPTLDGPSTELLDSAVRAVAETQEPGEVALAGDQHALLAPLGEHLSVPSILVLLYPADAAPDSHETDLLGAFAEQAGLAMDRVQALQDRAAMAVVSDRDRIARELHDVVIQRLFATGLHLQKSRSLASDPELQERLELTAHDLDQTIRAIRGTIFDLREQPRQSLRAALRDVVARHAPELGFTPTVHTQGPVDHALTSDAQDRLCEVLDQALSNIARHAEATSAQIDLHINDELVRVRVSDDGRGLSEDAVETGLASLRRRIAMAGGSLDLWAGGPGGEDAGATLVAQLPRG